MHQERDYPNHTLATELKEIDFAKWAESFGAYGAVVEKTEDFAPAFGQAMNAGEFRFRNSRRFGDDYDADDEQAARYRRLIAGRYFEMPTITYLTTIQFDFGAVKLIGTEAALLSVSPARLW